MGGPDICGQNGQFIPFANTGAERLAAGDPRLSIEERYRNHGAYVSRIARAADRLVKEGFLTPRDRLSPCGPTRFGPGCLKGSLPRTRPKTAHSASRRHVRN